ncbi:TonB-dependent receptor [Membranihabitans marinus]
MEAYRDNDIAFTEAIKDISKRFDVYFTFDLALVQGLKVDQEYTEVSDVTEAIDLLLKDTDLKFQILQKRFVILYKNDAEGLKSMEDMIKHMEGIMQQQKEVVRRQTAKVVPLSTQTLMDIYNKRLVVNVTGRVVDQTGQPLVGVNVLVKGRDKGTATDFDGKFLLEDVDENAVLVVSYIGYQTQEIALMGKTNIEVVLQSDSELLDEVVVVGYGKQTKREVTGAISSISSEELGEIPTDGFARALSGKVAGVQIQQTTGAPGGNMNIRIRGTGSINAGNDPLYVIDGFPVEQANIGGVDQGTNPLSSINPDDILSIEILKDAAAASIYGSRAATGVVLITTKQGQEGKARINFNASLGTQSVINKLDLMNGDEFLDLVREAYANAANTNDVGLLPPQFLSNEAQYRGVNTDWQDQIFRNAPVANYQLSASGGNEKMNYYLSGGYLNEEGIVKSSGFERYSLRVNVQSELNDKLKLGVNLTPTYSVYDEVKAEGHWANGGVINIAEIQFPFLPLESNMESFVDNDATLRCCNVTNPLLNIEHYDGKSSQFRTIGNGYLEFELIKNLVFKTSIGGDFLTFNRSEFIPNIITRNSEDDFSNTNSFFQTTWLNENTLNYKKDIGGHKFNFLGGFSYQKFDQNNTSIEARGYSNTIVKTINSNSNTISNAITSIQEWSLVSLFGRVNYNYDNKYFLTASIRRDGSSRFGANNKYGTFPSVSVGWSILDEAFLQQAKNLSELKLRASYGISGNNRIGNYAALGLLQPNTYVLGQGTGSSVSGFSPSSIANPDLTWETTSQYNIGMEVGAFNDRLFFSVDYYNSETDNLLLNVPIPTVSGFTSALQNLGAIRNSGVEFLFKGNIINTDDFDWTTNFNISSNKNEVLKLGEEGDPIISGGAIGGIHITEIGGELGAFYLLEQEGIFQTQEEIENSATWNISRGTWPGDVKYKDNNNDGVIDANDRVVVGSPFPDFIWGLSNSFKYKNIDLNVVLNGVQGNSVLHINRRFIENLEANQNQLAVAVNRWKSPEEPGNGIVPRANSTTSGNNNQASTRWLEDGSFIRIQNITLGYNVTGEVLSKLNARSLRLYLGANNLAYFTKYLGYNPEVSYQGGSALNPGEDYGSYPLARRFTLGIKLGI